MNDRRQLLVRPFVVPADVLVVPAVELSERARGELECQPADYLVTRPRYRTSTMLVDEQTAKLLEEFRAPITIVDAIRRFSTKRDLVPASVLEDAFAALRRLTATMVLVPEDSPHTAAVVASYCEGQVVADRYEVRRLVRVLQDTEIYLASMDDGRSVALKLARSEALSDMHSTLAREAMALDHLNGQGAPKLVEVGTLKGNAFIAMEWISAVPVRLHARQLRAGVAPDWRTSLHRLCCSIADAYTLLHERGVLHGDVHGDNVVIDRGGAILILDFGLARQPAADWPADHAERSGLIQYMSPALALTQLKRVHPPAIEPIDEQFSVAALLFHLICGAPYVPLLPDRQLMLQRIVDGHTSTFGGNGFEAWPKVESVLATALDHDPRRRFASTRAFAEALAASAPPSFAPCADDDGPLVALRQRAIGLLRKIQSAPEAQLFERPPTASLQYGMAGLAWFLYRAALIRDDPDLLAEADIRSRLALREAREPGGLDEAEVGITPSRVSRMSLYHREPGIYLVRALISHARGDYRGLAEAIDCYARDSAEEVVSLELACGQSGLLLGGALILEAIGVDARLDSAPLKAFVVKLAAEVDSRCREHGPGMREPLLTHLGMAHGWGGVIYARLMATQVLGEPTPDWIHTALARLAALAEPVGRGLCWQGTVRKAGAMVHTPQRAPGWCAGSAGHIHLWTLAHECLGDKRWLECALGAGWHSWEHSDRSGHLCCGIAGRALALARLFQHTADDEWLRRARQLLSHTGNWIDEQLQTCARPNSLAWGQLGPLLAALELQSPQFATMPAFGRARWRRLATGDG